MTILLIVFINVVLLVSGQVLWKIGLNRQPLTSLGSVLPAILQPTVLLGCVLFAVATVVWFYALSRYDLSRVYPLQSMAYVIGALSGVLFLKETMSLAQWLGMLLIIGGAFLVART
jgi:undecaprenyl phosphate-alpha-L-ara4N flippase subunit ArnF